jgi:hypothetical protein
MNTQEFKDILIDIHTNQLYNDHRMTGISILNTQNNSVETFIKNTHTSYSKTPTFYFYSATTKFARSAYTVEYLLKHIGDKFQIPTPNQLNLLTI